MGTDQRVQVTERALLARVERALAKEGQTIRRCRHDSRWFTSMGRHYIVELSTNSVAATHVDLEELAKELGVLKGWEELEPES